MDLSRGMQLGPYEIVSSLGKGGMGEVYRAKDSRLDREVAIKVLSQSLVHQPDSIKRFEHEAKALAALSHPGIVSIYDVGKNQAFPFVVMELLEGETLRARISRSPLPWQEAIEIALPILEALAAAHSKGVIHRDLKPENIFITSDGRTKILDFGLARFNPILSGHELSVALTKSTVSQIGIPKGTIPYMSPEQLRGHPVNVTSDIFSFGCVLYEMLTGTRPFSRNTPVEMLTAIMHDPPTPISQSGNHVPPELEHVIDHCLEKDAALRFQSARDLAYNLKTILAGALPTKTSASPFELPQRRLRSSLAVRAAVIAIVAALLTATIYWIGFRRLPVGKVPAGDIKSLAVLPLQNLSADPKQDYFADGMTEELIANLARIKSLRVVSRTSVMEYKNARKPLPQIAKELNVDGVIEGSVLPAGNRVRITVQLIYAPLDQHVWAQSYERDLSNLLALQNDVALDITREIKASLTPAEQGHLSKARTIRPDAYQAYLKGEELINTPDLDGPDLKRSVEMFERAVQLDPNFAVAYTELSRAHSNMYFFQSDHTPERLAKAKAAVDRAFELQPGLPEAHLALGAYYYFCFRDFPKAIREFQIAEENLPGNTILLTSLGAARRRLGDFEAAFINMKKVHEINPRDPRIAWETGLTCTYVRKYEDADRYYDSAFSVGLDGTIYYTSKARNLVFWKGDTNAAVALLKKIPIPKDPEADLSWFHLEMFQRNYPAALGYAKRIRAFPFVGMINRLMKNDEAARRSFNEYRTALENAIKKDDRKPMPHSLLGMCYAGLGRKDEAIREGKLAVDLCPVSKDAIQGLTFVNDMIFIYVMVGEYDEALDQIDYALSIPNLLSVHWVKLDPRLDPLRDLPQYQKLLQKYQTE